MQRHLFVTIFYGVVTFIQSYSYNRPFKGKHNVDVARAENEFDTPALGCRYLLIDKWLLGPD